MRLGAILPPSDGANSSHIIESAVAIEQAGFDSVVTKSLLCCTTSYSIGLAHLYVLEAPCLRTTLNDHQIQ